MSTEYHWCHLLPAPAYCTLSGVLSTIAVHNLDIVQVPSLFYNLREVTLCRLPYSYSHTRPMMQTVMGLMAPADLPLPTPLTKYLSISLLREEDMVDRITSAPPMVMSSALLLSSLWALLSSGFFNSSLILSICFIFSFQSLLSFSHCQA